MITLGSLKVDYSQHAEINPETFSATSNLWTLRRARFEPRPKNIRAAEQLGPISQRQLKPIKVNEQEVLVVFAGANDGFALSASSQ